ncbi:MAG TPA: alanine--glyoxylate aminotransferase family protein [Gemmatimonas sp.]|nr:alanine--glyoxylate aminotransferase family protein [Gemmatimonas sp.]
MTMTMNMTSPAEAPPFGRFFLPGPTEVRREILEAMLAPMLPHRGAEFEAMFGSMVALLRPIFRTSRPVFVSTSSATGFMEMAVRCSPPGPILSLVNGAFSDRFADIARSVGRDVTTVDARWGSTAPLEAVEAALRTQHFAGMTVVHSETSTGVLTALPELSALAHRYDTLMLVDSVTGLAGAPVESDAWGIDVLLTGSQKALALPPGLAFAATSERFIRGASLAPARGRYFDVLEFEQYAAKHQTPNTPAISLLYATLAQAQAIAHEGMEARWARHAAMAEYTQGWIARTRDALGVELCTIAEDGLRSPTVTGIALPVGVRGDDVVAAVARRGFVIGGGYGKLKPTSIRIGHMGDHTVHGVSQCLDAVADALREIVGR